VRRGFEVVRRVLGVLLPVAAGLKLYGLNVTALPRVGWFAGPQVQVAAAAWELVLGLWLLSGSGRAVILLAHGYLHLVLPHPHPVRRW